LDKISKEKKDDKKDAKKGDKVKSSKPKRNEAVVNGRDVGISTKHAVAVCDFIRGKNVDDALKDLDEVSKMKRAIKMKGEIPHRKGKMMSGRYPLNAVKEITRLVKGLKANALNHELELEKFRLFCMANVAARPQRRFGSRRFKRSHVQLKLVPIEKMEKGK
jgi:ribosomal protein L22